MNPTDAAEVADYAKTLFPVTSAARIDSLGSMLLDFSNPAFARQCLLHHSQHSDALSIPAVRGMLELDENRRRETAQQRVTQATAAQTEYQRRRAADAAKVAETWKPVNELLDAMSDDDLAAVKADVVTTFPFLAKSDPKTHKGVRALIYERLTKRAPAPMRMANTAQDFDVD